MIRSQKMDIDMDGEKRNKNGFGLADGLSIYLIPSPAVLVLKMRCIDINSYIQHYVLVKGLML